VDRRWHVKRIGEDSRCGPGKLMARNSASFPSMLLSEERPMSLTTLALSAAYYRSEEDRINDYIAKFSMKQLPAWSKYQVESVSEKDGAAVIAGLFGKDFGSKATLTIDKKRGTMTVEGYQWLGTQPATSKDEIALSSPEAKKIMLVIKPQIAAMSEKVKAELARVTSKLELLRSL
jgi:hypothetical protein